MKTGTTASKVLVTIEGQAYEGLWTCEQGTVQVTSVLGAKSSGLGGLPADFVAKKLLRELVVASQP